MKAAIVLTTISVPVVLDSYCRNIETYGHKDEVGFIVVGDMKTPSEAGDYVRSLARKGFVALYLDIEAQAKWLGPYPDLGEIIPYNSDNRRNVGYLVAAERGAEVIISIDDDNYALPEEDFIGAHSIVGETAVGIPVLEAPNKWLNICGLVETTPPRPIYPRGFPYSKRFRDNSELIGSKMHEGQRRVMVNEGLWLDDPDVDAVVRLNEPVVATRISDGRIILARDNYSPINTQNTAYHRELLPCLYFVAMGFNHNGLRVDRYGDIWMGYFMLKVLHHAGGFVCFGKPTVRHIRNKHNLLNDLYLELGGMLLTERLVGFLDAIELTKTNYADAYLELGDRLGDLAQESDLGDDAKEYFRRLERNMGIWVEACGEVMR